MESLSKSPWGSASPTCCRLLPTAEPPHPLLILHEQAPKPTETLKEADRETLSMVGPYLARILESPTRR